MNEQELVALGGYANYLERVGHVGGANAIRRLIAEVRRLEKEYTEVLSDARKSDLAMLEAKAEIKRLKKTRDDLLRRYGGYGQPRLRLLGGMGT